MIPVVKELLELLELEQLEVNLFRGQPRASGQRTLFGGLVAAQATMAACRTVEPTRLVHSLHAYFLRPGALEYPIVYDVDRIRDGGSFATRRVNAIQQGKAIFTLIASFHDEETGADHQWPMPQVPPPEQVATDESYRVAVANGLPEPFRAAFLQERPIEFRPITPSNPFDAEPQDALRQTWFKVREPLAISQTMHRVLLTFCSDFGLMGTAMLPHGMHFFQPDVQGASLDHALWFHRPVRVDEWLLYVTDSPSAAGARGINRGLIYAQDGSLVATVAQEGLMRRVTTA